MKNIKHKAKRSADLKRKLKHDGIEKVKKQKGDLETTIKALKEGIIKETLHADDNQDLSATAKAVAFCCTLKQKMETLASLTTVQKKLEEEYKNL